MKCGQDCLECRLDVLTLLSNVGVCEKPCLTVVITIVLRVGEADQHTLPFVMHFSLNVWRNILPAVSKSLLRSNYSTILPTWMWSSLWLWNAVPQIVIRLSHNSILHVVKGLMMGSACFSSSLNNKWPTVDQVQSSVDSSHFILNGKCFLVWNRKILYGGVQLDR